MPRRLCTAALVLLVFFSLSTAQDRPRPDTTAAAAGGASRDSLAAPDSSGSVQGIDTVVNYSSADSIIYSIPARSMSLYSKGNIRYQKMDLQAERITINWNDATMSAFGVPDTSDTSGRGERGTPIMKDGPEEYHSKELGYNFRSKKGRLNIANTKIDQGYYRGDRIKKIGDDVLFIADGRYTTCDAPEPHYYFGSPKMKVTPGDKVIAEPVYLYIAGVPLFWLPLGVFPSHGGRRSGIIAPAIAEDPTHGRLLRHLGYYWAISDYMDINLKTDLYTKGSWAASSDYRYSLRYYLSGGISGQYRKLMEGESSDPSHSVDESYSLSINHHQELNPTTRFDANFTFASNNSFRNTIDLNQALQQDITSNATISKSWEGSPNSMAINISRRQNLIDGSLYEILPSVSFNHSQSYPFRFGRKGEESDLSWYEMIGVNYTARFDNNRNKLKRTVRARATPLDTLSSIQDFEFDRSRVLNQGVSMNISPKLGYFTISPSVSYSDQRIFFDNDIPAQNPSDSTFIRTEDRQTQRSGFFSSGISASTKVYGIVQPGILGIAAIRHTLTPNLSFTYSKQVVGENLAPRQMVMGLNVGNVFEMKGIQKEEGKEPTKITLLNLGAGISYNFSADSLNFSPIGLSYRTGIGNALDIGGGAGFDLYKLEEPLPGVFNRVNKFLINEEGRLARLTNFSIALSTSLSGERHSRKSSAADTSSARETAAAPYGGIFREEEPDFSIPWRLSLSWDYSEDKVPGQKSRASSVRGNLEFNLTENWKISGGGGYDITNRQVVVPSINVSRDLHCWFMNFSWVPTGAYRHYQFEIRLKAPQLQDVKVTKQGSERGIY